MEIERKLSEIGLELIDSPAPLANYLRTVQTGNLLFVSGHTPPVIDGMSMNKGKLGREVTIEQGYESARQTMRNCLSSVKAGIGDLDRVKRVVKLLCMVNCDPEFPDPPKVANGASDLLVELYGDRGRHARAAVGVASLPNNHCVEIEMILELEG